MPEFIPGYTGLPTGKCTGLYPIVRRLGGRHLEQQIVELQIGIGGALTKVLAERRRHSEDRRLQINRQSLVTQAAPFLVFQNPRFQVRSEAGKFGGRDSLRNDLERLFFCARNSCCTRLAGITRTTLIADGGLPNGN